MSEESHWEVVNLTKIGNSYGIILTRKMLKHMNVVDTKHVSILLKKDGSLGIRNPKRKISLNLDMSTWGKQIKDAIAAGHLPEPAWYTPPPKSLDEEWTWYEEYDGKGELITSPDKPKKSKKNTK